MPDSISPIAIATRGSALALAQANMILAQCRATCPSQTFVIQIIKTTGDKLQTASLASSSLPKGLFTKELEVALLQRQADFAVHSLKDLPTELPDGLRLAAVTQRADPRDMLVVRATDFPSQPLTVAALPKNATVATSSTRRAAQITALRPDLQIVPIRGNVPTRLRKLSENPDIHATLLAAAGLQRLHFSLGPNNELLAPPNPNASATDDPPAPSGLRAFPVPVEEMIPCVGQAAIGLESRAEDPRILDVCRQLNHAPTEACVTAERAFLRAMGGGCLLPVAGFAELQDHTLRLRAISFLTGTREYAEDSAPVTEAEQLGVRLAAKFSRPNPGT